MYGSRFAVSFSSKYSILDSLRRWNPWPLSYVSFLAWIRSTPWGMKSLSGKSNPDRDFGWWSSADSPGLTDALSLSRNKIKCKWVTLHNQNSNWIESQLFSKLKSNWKKNSIQLVSSDSCFVVIVPLNQKLRAGLRLQPCLVVSSLCWDAWVVDVLTLTTVSFTRPPLTQSKKIRRIKLFFRGARYAFPDFWIF